MQYRRFGRTGWNVSEIGYGMWGMAGWTGSEDAESLAALQRSIDLGCNFFDTAWAYGDGHSEELLGETLRANAAKKIYVATKVPPKNRCWPSKHRFSHHRSLSIRPRFAHWNAHARLQKAQGGLAQHLFRSQKPQIDYRTRRCAQTARPRRLDHGGNGSPLHSE